MSWLARLIVLTAAWSGAAGASELALRRVVLSSGGLGLYEFEAQVDGDATLELKAPRSQIDDILKSLVVFDDQGGVGGLDTDLDEPLARAFDALPFDRAALASAPDLIGALQGAEIEVGGPAKIAGRIVGVSEETATGANAAVALKQHRVTVSGEDGLRQFILEDAESVRFADARLREQIAGALAKVAASGAKDMRVLKLAARGKGARSLHVAYLAAAPVWKTSYRLLLDPAADAKTGVLQAWATLENLSGRDWKDVDLTLVSGRPVAFRQELYRPYMVERPEAPVDLGERLAPAADEGGVAVPATRKAAAKALGALMAARPAPAPGSPEPAADALSLASGAQEVAARESVSQVAFHLPSPVSLSDGRSLSLPIVDGTAKLQRVALYDPRVDARHPLSAVEFVNDRDSGLPPGIVTLYETGAGGAAYLGDARLTATPPGETRLLTFALDQKTTIEEDDSENAALARVRVAQGLLTVEDLVRRRAVYHVKAVAARKLVLLAPKLEGGHLTEPGSDGVTEAEGRLRVPFALPAGDGRTFTVTQERTQTRRVALADLGDVELGVFAKSGEIDADARATLARLADLRAQQNAAQRALEETKGRIGAIVEDQNRLRPLIGAVEAGSDLKKRYLRKLDADETDLEGLRVTLGQREKARDEARAALEAFVAKP